MSDEITTESGRTVTVTYGGQRPDGKKGPGAVSLVIQVKTPEGEHHLCGKTLPVLGKLNRWELAREAERLNVRADAIERGNPDREGVSFFDMRSQGKPKA
jgi:hypothetical protein